MGTDTSIEYADHTKSPWRGCSVKSAGCSQCFAREWARRWGKPELWLKNGPREIAAEGSWREFRTWNRMAEKEGRRHRVLCGTLCDVFEPHPGVIEARKRLWGMIEETPWVIYMLFTKRPEEVNGMVPWGSSWPGNAWLITSIEDQASAEERIPLLTGTHAPVKGLSIEPVISPIDFHVSADLRALLPQLDWGIIGGESGRRGRARPMELAWARCLVRQLGDAGVPRYVKQLGSVQGAALDADSKGEEWSRWPEDLRIRDLPPAAWLTPSDLAREN